jgi:integrase
MIEVRRKTVNGESWQPKTRRNRRVSISSPLRSYLEACRPASGSPWFFPSPTGKRCEPDNLSQDLRAINEKNGLPWSRLDFRHTFGTHLAQKGESLYKIAELLGNSPEICRRHYAALTPEEMRDTVEFHPRPRLVHGEGGEQVCA